MIETIAPYTADELLVTGFHGASAGPVRVPVAHRAYYEALALYQGARRHAREMHQKTHALWGLGGLLTLAEGRAKDADATAESRRLAMLAAASACGVTYLGGSP